VRPRNIFAIALLAFVTTVTLAQVSGGPTTRTPRLTVSPGNLTVSQGNLEVLAGDTTVENLTINGTCTGCGGGGGGGSVLSGSVGGAESMCFVNSLPSGWSCSVQTGSVEYLQVTTNIASSETLIVTASADLDGDCLAILPTQAGNPIAISFIPYKLDGTACDASVDEFGISFLAVQQ
jgi:hypothetical protein